MYKEEKLSSIWLCSEGGNFWRKSQEMVVVGSELIVDRQRMKLSSMEKRKRESKGHRQTEKIFNGWLLRDSFPLVVYSEFLIYVARMRAVNS